MNKKGLVVAIFATIFVVFLLGSVIAANETSTTGDIDKAYQCLKDQISNKTLSLKEATFSALALGSYGNLVDSIESQKDPSGCWPKGACNVKESSQVALAYNRMGKDTSDIKRWILSKNGTANEIKWLLEIDITNKVAASCTINDGQKDNKIKILDDSRIQGSFGSCLALDTSGYMLKINSNCLGNEFTISCDQDFVTSVLYQKSSGGTLFILPQTSSAASLGTTKEKVNGQCFKTNGVCDYEGSLWAALALQKMGMDISSYTPYLLAFSDDNQRYLPAAFLYILVGGDDQYNEVIQQQKQGEFWEMVGTKDGRYYDTSLAMLALASNGGAEIDATKSYLSGIQTKEGCWNNNNIRDTAFLLYSGWPRAAAGGGSLGSSTTCESNPLFSCENGFDCTQAGGTIEYSYSCSFASSVCCSIKVPKQTCAQQSGTLCASGTTCTGRTVTAIEGSCCIDGECAQSQAPAEDTCTVAGGTCSSTCSSGESTSSETCALANEQCCMPAGGSSLWFWIILLIILIILVALGIVFREKVKIWWFKFQENMKSRFGKKPVTQTRTQNTGFNPNARPMANFQRPMIQQRSPLGRPIQRDKEMEEALRKLREMSKK